MLKENRKYSIFLIFLLIAFNGMTAYCGIDDNVGMTDEKIIIAVLPFADFANRAEAKHLVIPLIEEKLIEKGFDIIPVAEIRKTLRKYRIRTAGLINAKDALVLSENSPATHLLLGAIDFYDKTNVEAGFSIRIVNLENMEIIWTISTSACGIDYESVFGLGKINNITILIENLVNNTFSELSPEFLMEQDRNIKRTDKELRVIIPFDNLSTIKNAASITNNILLSVMYNRGIKILEPGIVHEIFRRFNRLPRGEVDFEILMYLKSEYGINYAITGTVDNFRPGISRSRGSTPMFEYSCRYIDANNGTILAANGTSGRGTDYETIFKLGKVNSLGTLIQKVLQGSLDKLENRLNRRLAIKR